MGFHGDSLMSGLICWLVLARRAPDGAARRAVVRSAWLGVIDGSLKITMSGFGCDGLSYGSPR
jgi:hypothetical protein